MGRLLCAVLESFADELRGKPIGVADAVFKLHNGSENHSDKISFRAYKRCDGFAFVWASNCPQEAQVVLIGAER